MPASNVSRVRSDGFSKNIAICLPARAVRKSSGRAFIRPARWNNDSTSMGDRSRIETRSRPGIALTAACGIAGTVRVWLLNECLLSTLWLLSVLSLCTSMSSVVNVFALVEGAIQCINNFVQMLLLDNVRWQEAQHSFVSAIDQNPLLQQMRDNCLGDIS